MANPNIEMLKAAVSRLGVLANELVFVGGCTTGLFVTDRGATYVRFTKDVDGIVEAVTYSQYNDFGDRLRQAGFANDNTEGAPICRWINGDTVLDVMPIKGEFLGFNSAWYDHAVRFAQSIEISAEHRIRVVTPVYFLATKLEAFQDRGKKDFLGSQDLEDILTVVNGREELLGEVEVANSDVRIYICEQFRRFLKDRNFLDSLPGHLNPDIERVGLVLERIKGIVRAQQG